LGNKTTAGRGESVGGDVGGSLPIAYRLLPAEGMGPKMAGAGRRRRCPKRFTFRPKPEIALDQIRAAVAAKVDRGVVLADAAYGINTEFSRRTHRTGPAIMSWGGKVR